MIRADLKQLVLDALIASGGSAKVVDIAKHIWSNNHAAINVSGDLLYTWQYDMRWAANGLRHDGLIKQVNACPRGIWALV